MQKSDLPFFKVLELIFTFCLASANISGGMIVIETEINNGQLLNHREDQAQESDPELNRGLSK